MRIAICDDDEQELVHFLRLFQEYQLIRGKSIDCHSFRNSIDFLCDLRGGEYDLILLNASMSGSDGMQAAREIRELDENVEIIFVSSSPEFAVESYHVGAYYYLLKPVDADALFPLLDSVESKLFVREEQGLVLKSRKGVVRVPFTRLEYVEVINKTVFFHLAEGAVYKITAALADFEEKLSGRPEFLKTHRSYLVNLNYVQEMGINCVVMRNGHDIPVSRHRHNQVQDAYMHFLYKTGTETLSGGGRAEVHRERPENVRRILLVDDDMDERLYWTDILQGHDCVVEAADNGRDALKLVAEKSYDCVLLDVMIPGEDGFSICEKLRKLKDIPVIFLSCVSEADRQLEGFAAGGIDYITKDTPPELFWAKVETRIRLAARDRVRMQVCYGPLLLDFSRRRARMEGMELFLTSEEFDILWQLSEHAGCVLTPEEICGLVYGGRPGDGGEKVQIHMSRLRRKLDKAWGKHHFIETVWGKGYRFVPTD